jgi:predicted nucleic acid-binding protein
LRAVLDESVLACAVFPDEEGQKPAHALLAAHALGSATLLAPTLLPYELASAFVRGLRRGRLSEQQAQSALKLFDSLRITLLQVRLRDAVAFAQRFACSAYDAAYLTLAKREGLKLITADRKLYDAVAGELPWVVRLEDWQARIPLEGE